MYNCTILDGWWSGYVPELQQPLAGTGSSSATTTMFRLMELCRESGVARAFLANISLARPKNISSTPWLSFAEVYQWVAPTLLAYLQQTPIRTPKSHPQGLTLQPPPPSPVVLSPSPFCCPQWPGTCPDPASSSALSPMFSPSGTSPHLQENPASWGFEALFPLPVISYTKTAPLAPR